MKAPFILITLIILLVQQVYGQDKKAETLLSNTRSKVSNLVNMVATFNKTLEIRGSKKKPVAIKGKLKIKKEKFRVELTDQLVICNGKKMWSYLVEDRECTESEYDPQEGFTPDKIFNLTQKNMKTKYEGAELVNGIRAEKVTLISTVKTNDYFKIETWIDSAKLLPVQVKIWNRNGSIVTFQITNVDTSVTLSDSEFNFNPKDYPGIELIKNTK